MTALEADRGTDRRDSDRYSFPALASTLLYQGSLAVLDSSGWCKPGVTATGLIAVGMVEERVDNSSGANGALNVPVRAGIFRWENSDAITKTSIGDTAYVVDDQTVAKTSTGKSPAGIIVDVDSYGVWVSTNPASLLASTGLLAANNLSDIGTVATALANLELLDGSKTLQLAGLQLTTNAIAPTEKVAVVTVSATELRTLAAAPKTLVAGVAGHAYVFKGAFVRYHGGSNAFDSVGAGEDLAVRYTNGSGQLCSPALDTTTDINFGATTDDESFIPPLATVVNPVTAAALVLDNVGGGELAAADNDANGDGTLTVAVHYIDYTIA